MAGPDVAVREFPASTGPVDYALFVDGIPVGVVEAKADGKGENITTVEGQSSRYAGSISAMSSGRSANNSCTRSPLPSGFFYWTSLLVGAVNPDDVPFSIRSIPIHNLALPSTAF